MVDFASVLGFLGEWGYLLVFLAATAEALPFVGLLVPGQAVVVAAAFFAAQGHLSVWPLLVAAFLAGVIGDAVGYELGKRHGRRLLEEYGPRFRIEQRHLDRADALFVKYGPLAVVAARFSFLTRGIGPLLAGVTRMRSSVFWTLNVVGAVAWAVAYVGLGYLFGETYRVLERAVGLYLLLGLAGAVGVYVLYRVLRKANALFTREDAAFAAVGAFAVVAFARLAQLAAEPGAAPLAVDEARPMMADALAPLMPLWGALGAVGSYFVLGPLILVAFGVLAWRRRFPEAALLGLGLGGTEVIVSLLKLVFMRPRPLDGLYLDAESSFPSGHSAAAVVLAGSLVYLAFRFADRAWVRAAAVVAGAAFVVAMGLSRVALRMHYPTDVIGGYLVGTAWLCVVLLVVEYAVKRAPGSPGLLEEEPPERLA